MPPFIPRKRRRAESLDETGSSLPMSSGRTSKISTTHRKPTLFDDLDSGARKQRSTEHTKVALNKLAHSDDDESSLSSLSDEFEDVPIAKRRKTNGEEEEEDEDTEFEDVVTSAAFPANVSPAGDLELTLTKDTRISITNPLGTKKGPSKIERQIRIATHQSHVQSLMWHNAIRNSWLCDKELQGILVSQLTPAIEQQVEKWRYASGFFKKEDTPKSQSKINSSKGKKVDVRGQRDWGEPAQRLAVGQADMSAGDPLFRLLRTLLTYWKQRFRITAPALRKIGYMSLHRIDEEIKSFYYNEHDPETHGERIRDLEEFRECAIAMEGSRDVGAQLFTALLRGLGLKARMVASLQPLGFAWSQNEEALEKNPRALKRAKVADETEDSESEDSIVDITTHQNSTTRVGREKAPVKSKSTTRVGRENAPVKSKSKTLAKPSKRFRRSNLEDTSINLSESDSSVVDVTPAKNCNSHSLPYDKDLEYPHYWTEVLSPVTNKYTPVDAVVKFVIATNPQLLEQFEPRGGKSEKAKQVVAYIVGHSSDGTAKDVTTRYLKGKLWPGKTRGYRNPIEKIAIRNRDGKVKRYEYKDWFKNLMALYERGSKNCPRDDIDDHEEATDLRPAKRENKELEQGKETLQYYKSSTEYVLERHLKREEAVVPTAKYVKMFSVGKGENTVQEKVFLRKDVVNCKSIETWHKEGRAPKPGEEPLKCVPYRAATKNRKRELAEAEHASGEKMLQGLFSHAQTEWIIPPAIENGIIPKNSFGNIDLYVESMLPKGAVHIPYRGIPKICKRLGVDYAEAVTGFEFGHRMAVPIITGVVVSQEHYETIIGQWQKDEAERVRKEDEKRTKIAICLWRKMLMGLRIIERVKEEYGDVQENADVLNPFINEKKGVDEDRNTEAQKRVMDLKDEEMAGGFLPEGFDAEELEDCHPSGFFPVAKSEEEEDEGDEKVYDEESDEAVPAFTIKSDTKSQKPVSQAPPVQNSNRVQKVPDAQGRSEGPVHRTRMATRKYAAVVEKDKAKKREKEKAPINKRARLTKSDSNCKSKRQTKKQNTTALTSCYFEMDGGGGDGDGEDKDRSKM